MKHQLCPLLITCLALLIGLPACGGPDDSKPRFEVPKLEPKPPKTKRTVRATKEVQKAALDRLAVMKEITAVLKTLRQPDVALAGEAELQKLFDQYFQHTEFAATEGISDRLLAELTAHLAPDAWGDARQEFHMYILLVRQLGEPQRDMMERLMREEGNHADAEGGEKAESDGESSD